MDDTIPPGEDPGGRVDDSLLKALCSQQAGRAPFFDVRKEIVDPARAQGRIVSIPLVSVPPGCNISPEEWAGDPAKMAEVVENAMRLNLVVVFPPMDLSVLGATLGLERFFADNRLMSPQLRSSNLRVQEALGQSMPDELEGTALGVRIAALERLSKQHPGTVFGEYVLGPQTLAIQRADPMSAFDAVTDYRPDPSCDYYRLLEESADISIKAAEHSIKAGARVIAILDPACSGSGMLGPSTYERLLPHTKKLVDGIHDAGATAILHVCGFTKKHLDHMLESGADILSLDCRPDPKDEHRYPEAADIREVCGRVEQYNQAKGKDVRVMTGFSTAKINELIRVSSSRTVDFTRESEQDTRTLIQLGREFPDVLILSSTCEMPSQTPQAFYDKHFQMVEEAGKQKPD